MPRYIDAEELWIQLDKAELFEQGKNHAYYKGLRKAKRILSEQPTADVVERKKGKWVRKDIKGIPYCCSVCTGRFDYEWKFCPNCGADMRGDGNDN